MMSTNLDALSQFAFSMATCLSSGLPPRKALELSGQASQSHRLKRAADAAAETVDQGLPISDGLELHRSALPGFVIPILRAGEMGGREVEAFKLIHEHCVRLKPAMRAMRNTWLYPLMSILAGWVVRAGLFLGFGLYGLAWHFVRDTFVSWGAGILVCWTLWQTPLVKRAVDRILIELPLVRETLIRVDVVLFFTTFQLAYDAGGLSATAIFDLALATVHNSAIRTDLARARRVLEEHGSFEDAFGLPSLIDDRIKSSITSGAISGHLGSTLRQIVETETTDLEILLERFNNIFQRLLAYSVAMSVVGTFLFCLSYRGK